MDHQVGVLLDALVNHGVANQTVVAFFGDHGWQLGEHAEWEKFTNFELAARVPLIVRAPALAALNNPHNSDVDADVDVDVAMDVDGNEMGRVSAVRHELVELVDVMPTIIELATPGAYPEAPAGLEGVSLVPLMQQGLQPA